MAIRSEEAVEIVGTLGRVWRNESGFARADVETDDGDTIVAIGEIHGVSGEPVRLMGRHQTHPKYGPQFVVTSQGPPPRPLTVEGITRYLASGAFPGIGKAMATRIARHFGRDAIDILQSQPERLGEVPGIGPKKAKTIRTSLEKDRVAESTMLFLYSLGVPRNVMNAIFKRYGEDSERIVREDPYLLTDTIGGVGFRTADRIARSLRVGNHHPHRIESAIRYTLLEHAEQAGDTKIPLKRKVRRVSRTGAWYETEEGLLHKVRLALDKDGSLGITRNEIVEGLKRCEGLGLIAALDERTAVGLTHLLRSELSVAADLIRLGAASPEPEPPDATALVGLVKRAETSMGLELSDAQKDAIALALTHTPCLVTGGPGTGKTTVMRGVVAALGGLGIPTSRIALAAPTGRAAKRLSETTGVEASTIHRLLGMTIDPNGMLVRLYMRTNPIPVQAIVVDEASMIDVRLMAMLLEAVADTTRLLIVGDPAQLPSVGPGQILGDLVDRIPTVKLDRTFRQAAKSTLLQNVTLMRQGEPPAWATSREGDWAVVPVGSAKQAADKIEAIIRDAKGRGLRPEHLAVLSPMHPGDAGTDALNQRLQAVWRPARSREEPHITAGEFTYRQGDRVIILRNDYEQGAMNGDLGEVLEIVPETGDEPMKLAINVDGTRVEYPKNALPQRVALAYSMTVHKAQGSEFPLVLAVCVPEHVHFLTRQLLYTAATRAKDQLVVVGDEATFRRVTMSQEGLARLTMLGELLDRRTRQP